MLSPLQITFRGLCTSEAIESIVRKKAEKLTDSFPWLEELKVTISAPHHSHHKGNFFHIHTECTLRGRHVVISREPEANPKHQDVYLAIQDAFLVTERRLRDLQRERRAGRRAAMAAGGLSAREEVANLWGTREDLLALGT